MTFSESLRRVSWRDHRKSIQSTAEDYSMTSRVPEDLPEQWDVSQFKHLASVNVILCFYGIIFTGLVCILSRVVFHSELISVKTN